MKPAEGLAVSLVASEPLVRQPVAIEFDDRGRLWVIQYLQYPNPAGLKRARVDRYSRTVYDRVPEPPPRGPKGADRITILEDTDHDGVADRAKDFFAGLNLASGLAFGHGGVFVLQPPYLLFYPDRDCNDIPDGDPEVLLSGFGIEDAHSVANSLTWGPDGWLYGCQGSTVTAIVRGIRFQQGVWRYHPLRKEFELFCEGGGNSWGLDFDADGELFYSTNFGGFTMLHGVQGGYYWKLFSKHGPLHNPFAYGWIDHVPHANFVGGHVTVGGFFYHGDTLPDRFHGRYVAGDLLGHQVLWHEREPVGTSFRSRHGGVLLAGNDTWFATSDATQGPDGAVYVADWHDRRTAHPDPDADWDRSNGRVYRIQAIDARPRPTTDVAALSRDRLLALLGHPNHWHVRRARRVLADRRDPEVILPLRATVLESTDPRVALESLWALYVSGGWSEPFGLQVLRHANPILRRWAVRFFGDERTRSCAVADQLIQMARHDPDTHVRKQLLCSVRRLEPRVAWPVVEAIVGRDLDADDPHIPLFLWWTLEPLVAANPERVERCLSSPNRMLTEHLVARLVRRLVTADTSDSLTAVCRLLQEGNANATATDLLTAVDDGLADRTSPVRRLPTTLDAMLLRLAGGDRRRPTFLRIWLRTDPSDAVRFAESIVADQSQGERVRLATLQALTQTNQNASPALLLELLEAKELEAIELAAMDALAPSIDGNLAKRVVAIYPRKSRAVRARMRSSLIQRKDSASILLGCVERGSIAASDVSVGELQLLAALGDADLHRRMRHLWAIIQPPTSEERLAEIRRLQNDLRAFVGNAERGKLAFRKHCANCHRLGGDGNNVGPDLAQANRKDRDFMLTSLVDPSAVVRREYIASVLRLRDGRVLTGLIVASTPGQLTLALSNGEKQTITRSDVEQMEESPISLMPENLHKGITPDELRDLFQYLQTDIRRD